MRRIVAIVLPQLACEIARRKRTESSGRAGGPIGVLLEPDGAEPTELPSAVLDAVEDEARRYGVRPGQRVTEAAALLAGLSVQRVTYGELDAALGRVAEVALGFGPTAALQLRAAKADAPRTPWGDAPFDTVWLDVTGAAHLVGGEEALLAELEERVGALGHRARLAIAGGPRLAQALARWAPGVLGTPGARGAGRYPIAPEARADAARALAPLPVHALPIEADWASFLMRLGVITVGDLARLPRAKAAPRLGPNAPPRCSTSPPAATTPTAPLRAAARDRRGRELRGGRRERRGAALRAARDGVARGRAARRARRGVLAARGGDRARPVDREAPAPGSRRRRGGGDREGRGARLPRRPARAARGRGGSAAGAAREARAHRAAPRPRWGCSLAVTQIVPAPRVQLDLSRATAADPDSLPALLAELSAEIGPDRLGLLSIEDAHRPEATSRLVPVTLGDAGKERDAPGAALAARRVEPARTSRSRRPPGSCRRRSRSAR